MEFVKGAVLTCQDVCYTVNVRPPDKAFGKKEPKLILKNIHGIFKPGLNAILGPTGSGKTSLLDVLAGRKNPKGLKGTVLVDGGVQPKNFKCMTGYVVQDDVVMGTLTVRENFMFSANVRLPSTVSVAEKEKKVQEVINQLGLTHCADTKVGTEFIRGVSGGERKRTNIGMELIVSQSVLFLDEPTTGLDASTANAVIGILKQLSEKGTTVIFSIHQPRYSIFKMFDHLILLSLGQVVYHGPSAEALDFFSTQGYECEAHNNPPDFFLDVINGESSAVKKPAIEYAKANNSEKFTQKNGSAVDMEFTEDHLSDKLHTAYEKSTWNQQISDEIKQEAGKSRSTDSQTGLHGDYATGIGTQFHHVAVRTLKNSFRNPATTIAQSLVMVVFAAITGLIYLQIDNIAPEGIQNRVGAFFFIIMNMIFGNLSAVELFIQERKIFVHENGSGFYSVLPYFMGKILCDTIPLRCVPVMIFSVIVYFMIGLVTAADKFFIFLLNLVLTTLCASAVGFFVSASVKVFAIANLLIALIYVFMMVFGGLLVNLESIWVGIRWLQYFSVFKYSLNTLVINEMKDQEYITQVVINGTELSRTTLAGNAYMDDIGIEYETSWDLWQNQLALICMTIGFMALAYIQLRRIPKWK